MLAGTEFDTDNNRQSLKHWQEQAVKEYQQLRTPAHLSVSPPATNILALTSLLPGKAAFVQRQLSQDPAIASRNLPACPNFGRMLMCSS